MRATLMMGILGASFTLLNGAEAQPRRMSEAEQRGYDRGWDTAQEFCRDLRRPPRGGFGGRERLTREYQRGCRRGFDEHINSNRTCQRRIKEQDKYDEMWDARKDMCD
jgi:hypothetical protein